MSEIAKIEISKRFKIRELDHYLRGLILTICWKRITIFINALAYKLSQYNNGMQKLLYIYFKAKGVPKSCYHLFQRCGIVYSYTCSVAGLVNISQAAMKKVIEVFEEQPCIII